MILRVLIIAWLSCCLSGCWFVVRLVDDQSLHLDPRFHGRWQTADGSGELVITAGRGCSLVQMLAENGLLRLCSLGAGGDYVLTAFHELGESGTAELAAREYTLVVARWYGLDRLGLVMVDAKVALAELDAPHVLEIRDPACAARSDKEQQQPACTRLVLDPAQLSVPSQHTLAALYASGCCTGENDESILLRVAAPARDAEE